jgi:transcriptional regulator
MYIPKHFEETRLEVLHGLIRSHPFATLVIAGTDGLSADHIPFLLDDGAGEFGTLRAHVARANPVWQKFSSGVEALIVFQGPNAYVSPNWYPSKQEHHKVVPTWDYAVVHVRGVPRAVEDGEWLMRIVSDLSAVHEAGQVKPWTVAEAPRDYLDKLLERIVGLEIPITRMAGKWKAQQPRPPADKLGAIAGLNAVGSDAALGVAQMIERAMPKSGV